MRRDSCAYLPSHPHFLLAAPVPYDELLRSPADFAERLYGRAFRGAESGQAAGSTLLQRRVFGARDSEVGKALGLMHSKPAHPWTIASLAKEAGISRSVLAERFRHYLDQTPIAYLTRWRLQLGAQMLASTNDSVLQIAAEVGYESESAFNRAFKREFEIPPARFRSQSRSARNLPGRSG